MGLAAKGENGVKAMLRRKYPEAFSRHATVADATQACGRSREEVVATVDGNVLLMQIPGSVERFVEYVDVVANILRAKLRSATVVVVVFDEPEILTKAKREEQQKRDASRQQPATYHSADIASVPTDDAYDGAALRAVRNCHEVVASRAARSRFYDAIGVELVRCLGAELAATATAQAQVGGAGVSAGVVVFDGLDPRGAKRPPNAPREVRLFGAGPDVDVVADALRHGPIGEGDLKLAAIEESVRRVAALPEPERPAPLRAACVHFAVTIDTDSLAIGLLERARLDVEAPTRPKFQSALLMRERAPKRGRDGEEGQASYLVCDYDALYLLVQKDLWNVRLGVLRQMDPVKKRIAMTLTVGGWILAGSDYAGIKGLHATMTTEAVPGVLHRAPRLREMTKAAWSGDVSAARLLMPQVLRRLVDLSVRNYAEGPRVRRSTLADLEHYDEVQLRRAAWCCAYWSGWEICDDLDEFGFALA